MKLNDEQKEEIEEKNDNNQKKHKKKNRVVVWTIVVLLLCSILFIYLYGVYFYDKHLFPNTLVNNVDCKNMDYDEVLNALQNQYKGAYQLTLIDKNGEEILTIVPDNIGMTFSLDEGIKTLFTKQEKLLWPIYFLKQKKINEEVEFTISFHQNQLESYLNENRLFDHNGKENPQDAYISEFLDDKGQFEIVEEKEGTGLNKQTTIKKLIEAIMSMQTEIDLESSLCYEQPSISSDDKKLVAELAELNKLVSSCITYDWNGNEVILNGDTIKDWIIVDDEVALDYDQVKKFVSETAKEYDTYGKTRSFTTTSGMILSVPGGKYGWKTDKSKETDILYDLILQGSTVEREPEYVCRGYVKGKNDIGSSYVEINLTAQYLYLYMDGEIVLESKIVSGNVAEGRNTPAGVFGITYKKTEATLKGEDYESHVSFWMPFNGNIGMHDATWRRKFGGQIYLTNGSHGCVNLPLKKAAAIFDYVEKGFPVICYYEPEPEPVVTQEPASVTPAN